MELFGNISYCIPRSRSANVGLGLRKNPVTLEINWKTPLHKLLRLLHPHSIWSKLQCLQHSGCVAGNIRDNLKGVR